VFDYWNAKKIHIHKDITPNIQKQIEKLTKSQVEEVKQAIDNYYAAFKNKNYYYSHVWTLDKFIKQSNGYTDWLEDGSLQVAYKNSSEYKQSKPIEVVKREPITIVRREIE